MPDPAGIAEVCAEAPSAGDGGVPEASPSTDASSSAAVGSALASAEALASSGNAPASGVAATVAISALASSAGALVERSSRGSPGGGALAVVIGDAVVSAVTDAAATRTSSAFGLRATRQTMAAIATTETKQNPKGVRFGEACVSAARRGTRAVSVATPRDLVDRALGPGVVSAARGFGASSTREVLGAGSIGAAGEASTFSRGTSSSGGIGGGSGGGSGKRDPRGVGRGTVKRRGVEGGTGASGVEMAAATVGATGLDSSVLGESRRTA